LPIVYNAPAFDIRYPNSRLDGSQVALDTCPVFCGKIGAVPSAAARFFAPSDPGGLNGVRKEHIRATSSWYKGPPRYDCILVHTGEKPGPGGLSVARVLMFFKFTFNGEEHSAAIVRWYSFIGETFDDVMGMWMVQPTDEDDGSPCLAIISAKSIYRACHLIPIFNSTPIPLEITADNSLDLFTAFYLNKFADHHSFETLS
jgi:hypothetical protein